MTENKTVIDLLMNQQNVFTETLDKQREIMTEVRKDIGVVKAELKHFSDNASEFFKEQKQITSGYDKRITNLEEFKHDIDKADIITRVANIEEKGRKLIYFTGGATFVFTAISGFALSKYWHKFLNFLYGV